MGSELQLGQAQTMSVPSDPFFRLPTELCCSILREWLHFDTVVNLDSAVCNAEKRSLLWNTIFASSQCIVRQGSSCHHTHVLLDWLAQRQLRTCGLHVSWEANESVRQYLRAYGDTIRTIEFALCDTLAYMALVRQYCPNVACLLFVDRNAVRSEDVFPFFSPKLTALDLTSVSDDALERIVTQCPYLTHLAFPAYCHLADNCGDAIGRNLKQLKLLNVSNSYVTDKMLLDLAEHSSNTLEEFHMEYCDNVTGTGFSALLKKCTKLKTAHITYSENTFIDFDFSLLGNLTELFITNQNDTQAYMTSLVQHCSKVERLLIDWRDSPPRVRYSRLFHLKELTIERLPNLKVLWPFGMSQSEIDAFSAMRPDVCIEFSFDAIWWSFFDITF